MSTSTETPEDLLQRVHDRDTFIAFVRALALEREAAEEEEQRNPDRYQVDGAYGWKNADIASFLFIEQLIEGGTVPKKNPSTKRARERKREVQIGRLRVYQVSDDHYYISIEPESSENRRLRQGVSNCDVGVGHHIPGYRDAIVLADFAPSGALVGLEMMNVGSRGLALDAEPDDRVTSS